MPSRRSQQVLRRLRNPGARTHGSAWVEATRPRASRKALIARATQGAQSQRTRLAHPTRPRHAPRELLLLSSWLRYPPRASTWQCSGMKIILGLCYFYTRSIVLLHTLEHGVSRLREPPEGPKGFHQDAHYATIA